MNTIKRIKRKIKMMSYSLYERLKYGSDLRKNEIYVFDPISISLSSGANIDIKSKLVFNENWDEIRTKKNLMHGQLFVYDGAKLNVGYFKFLSGCRVTVSENAKLTLKSGYMNYEGVIECFDSIEIGEKCCISERVIIRDNNDHVIERSGYKKTSPIKIGNHVWIGMGATILSGVNIGDNVVIAAGAVVNRDIPSNTLAAGVPAKVVRENIQWS